MNPFDDLIPRPGAVRNAPSEPDDEASPQFTNPMPGTLMEAIPAAPRLPPVQNALASPVAPEPGGWTDPQQYIEGFKGVIPGAIKSAGTTLQAPDVFAARGQQGSAAFGRAQSIVMDRIDRGEFVPETEDPIGYQHMTPDQRRAVRGDVQAASQAFAPTPVQDRTLYQAGEAVQNFAKTVLPPAPGYDKAFGRDVGEGGGSLVFGLPFAFLGTLPGAAVFGSMGVGEATQRAVEFDRKEKAAGKPGLSQEQITTAGLLGIGPGMTDVAPVEVLLGRLPVRVPEVLRRPLAQGIGRIGIQATIEGVQEGGQGFLQDLIARETYNPSQVLGENFQREAEVGGAVGGIAEFLKQVGTGMVRSAAGRRGASQSATAQPPSDAPQLPQERQEPQLPWWAPPSQETPPAATPEALPTGAAPPAATAGNPFSDLIPANVNTPLADAPWVAELAHGMAARKAGQPDIEADRSEPPSGVQPPDGSQPQPVRQPDSEPDILGAMPPPSSVVTPDGSMEIEARPELVELDDLNLAGGALQPRDRSRAEYVQGARERASRLDPMQLQPSRVSDTGAPIVMPDGTVLSGNGRTMSIAEVYTNPAFVDRAEAYRASLGPAAANMRQPVLVMRAANLTPAQAVQFADLSNRGRIAQMSATERAIRDAQSMGVDGISLYEGGDFTAPQNRRFLQDFMSRVVTTAERPSISRNGELTQEGVGRMRAAVLAAAYGDADVLARMLESTDDNVRSLTGGLLDASPRMAQLRAGIASGEVSPDMDAVPAIMEAVRTISDLRSRKQPVQQWLAQTDAFGRDPVVEAWVKSFYYDQTNKAKGQQKVAALLNDYATEAMLHRPGGLFADTTTPNDVLGVAQRKNDADQAADLFAPTGTVGQGVQEGGAGTAGRANAAGRKGLGKVLQSEGAVSGDILAAIQSSPSRLEYEARELLRDVQDFEASLRAQNATPGAIATAINERYGTQVTADEIESRDVWWRPLPGEEAKGYVPDIPEFAVENLLETDRQATGNDIAPMDVDARPSSPQQIRGTTGAASPGPKLTQDMRERAAQLAQEGRPPRQIANVLKSETGRYVTATQIEDAIKALTRVDVRPRGRAVKRTPMSPEERREANSARMRERMSSPEARALQADRARAQMSTPEAKAAQAAVMRATLARPEMQAYLKERGKALAAARGYALWSPAMVERLGSPDVRAMTAEQAAAQLTREFPGTTVTRDSVRQKRYKLGYGFTGAANAPKISAAIAERLADPTIRRLNANEVLDRLAAELGADAVAGISVQNINDKRNSDPRLAFTGKAGNPNLNAGKFVWSPDADARLVALMTEAPNPSTRAEMLNAEFGGPTVPKLTAKATIKRWHKIRDAALRSQGSEPMFALGPWVNAKNWLAWIGGKTDVKPQSRSAEQGSPRLDRQSAEGTGQQPGADTPSPASDGGAGAGRFAEGYGRIAVGPAHTAGFFEGPANRKGLRQVIIEVRKAWNRPDPKGSQWAAKAKLSEIAPGEWEVSYLQVRGNLKDSDLASRTLDVLEQEAGQPLSAPSEMTPAFYNWWRNRQLEGSRFRITDVDGYVQYAGRYYTPERIRGLRDLGAETLATAHKGSIEQNLARKELRELDDIVERLPPEDIVSPDLMAAVQTVVGIAKDRALRSQATRSLLAGKSWGVEPDVVAGILERSKPFAKQLIPIGTTVGALEKIQPYNNFASTGGVKLTFRLADGSLAHMSRRWHEVSGLRNGVLPVTLANGQSADIVGFLRFDLTGYSDETIRGELAHEGVHVLWRRKILGDRLLVDLAGHSASLGLMDQGLKSYLTAIGNPDAANANNNKSLRDIYAEAYAGRPDFEDAMLQEAVAHMVELYANGRLTDKQIAPVRPILDSILDGSIWRGRQGSERELETGDAVAAVQRAIKQDRTPNPDLDMSVSARLERAKRMGFDTSTVWYHGANRSDRIAKSGKFDPKRATSGPMAFFSNDPQVASNYSTGKPDTSMPDDISIAQYFTVSPKDVGHTRSRTPYTVEQSWNFLTPEQRREIMAKAKRVGYANQDTGDGDIILHPEGVDASISSAQFDYYMKTSARGNPLAALRELWHDSGSIFGEEHLMADIWRLAGYPHKISQENAPWTENPGVFPVYLRMMNPLDAMDYSNLTSSVIPALDEALKGDRTRSKEFGADGWDKNSRYTPKEWVQQLKDDVASGKVSYVWTSIPDKVTDVIKRLGYDGIIDRGNKGGNPIAGNNTFVPGEDHTVAIPFYANNVRSVMAAFDPKKAGDPHLLAAIQRQRDQQPQPPASWAPLVDAYRMGGDQGLKSEIGRRVPDLDAAESLWNSYPELGPMRWAGISIHDQIAAVAKQLARQSNPGIDDAEIVAAIQRQRDIDSLGYYSAALEAARSLKQAKGTPEQMLAQLKSAGVKDAEIEATGLDKLLRPANGPTWYHGTAAKRDNLRVSSPGEPLGPALYLAGKRNTAEGYARDKVRYETSVNNATGLTGHVHEGSVAGPLLVLDPADIEGTRARVHAFAPEAVVSADTLDMALMRKRLVTDKFIEKLRRAGYVGIELKEGPAAQHQAAIYDPAAFIQGKKAVTRDEIVAHLEGNRVGLREQDREGFAPGGASREFTQDQVNAERARMQAAKDDGWSSVGPDGDWDDATIRRDLYNRLAGETEARAVQKRMNLTSEERRARPPWEDYDVPEYQQIVKTAGKGVQQSTGDVTDRLEVRPMSKRRLHDIAEANFDTPYAIDPVERVPISSLSGSAFTSEKVAPLADAIQSNGWIEPLVIDADGNVIEGQHRLRALTQLGAQTVPVHRLRERVPAKLVSAMTAAARAAGVRSQHARQIAEQLAIIIDKEGIDAIKDYDAPTGFENAWNAAAAAVTKPKPRASGGPVSPSIDLSALDRALAILRRAKVDG